MKNRIPAESGRPRGVGDRLATRLERAMDKPAGWLDEPPAEESAPGDACPLLSWSRAGGRTEADRAEADDRTTYRCPVRCGPDTYVLRVRDAGMAPKFHEGDLLFVDPRASPDAGRYVIVRTQGSGEATFRQLVETDGRRYLRALNPVWPRPVVEATGDIRVRGVVVFKGEFV